MFGGANPSGLVGASRKQYCAHKQKGNRILALIYLHDIHLITESCKSVFFDKFTEQSFR